MSLNATVPQSTKTTLGVDTEIQVRIYVPQGGAWPADARATVTIPLTSGLVDIIDVGLAGVPYTGTGATNALKAANAIKEIVQFARTQGGYA